MIIDLAQHRQKHNRPDPQFICTDQEGREMVAFCGSYRLDTGETFGIDFYAYDFDDAEKRVEAIRSSLVLDGQKFSEISE